MFYSLTEDGSAGGEADAWSAGSPHSFNFDGSD